MVVLHFDGLILKFSMLDITARPMFSSCLNQVLFIWFKRLKLLCSQLVLFELLMGDLRVDNSEIGPNQFWLN